MRRMINGMDIEIPTNHDGTFDSDDLRKFGGIPHNRRLVLQRRDGGNQIINPGQKVAIRPEDHVIDLSITERGTGSDGTA